MTDQAVSYCGKKREREREERKWQATAEVKGASI
jgi:hypothetical protein